MKTNYHTHTTWCDGKASAEEMVKSAMAKGFDEIGFSSHAMLPADPLDWPLTTAKLPMYAAEIRSLAAKYAGEISILCGVEADYVKGACSPDRGVYSSISPDFIIGSVHFVPAPDGEWVPVDMSPESLLEGVRSHFGGSAEAFIRAYFAAEREMAETCDFDIIGHPDLCRKFNGALAYFDETAPWYLEEIEKTAAAFAKSGKTVEVNTGAISRGWMDDAYPSADFRRRLVALGINLILSSDAHAPEGLDCGFERFAESGVRKYGIIFSVPEQGEK